MDDCSGYRVIFGMERRTRMDMSEFETSGMLGDIPEAFRRYLGLETSLRILQSATVG
jgi:hypothetical protein